MIKQIYLPLWAFHCFKRGDLIYDILAGGKILVTGCRSKRECYGCNPEGTTLPIHPERLLEIEQFNSMGWDDYSLNSLYMSEAYISERFKKYAESKEQYYYWRGLSCDLDTIRIFKVKD